MEKRVEKDNVGNENPKEATIIVNGRPKIFTEKTISFRQVIELAFGTYIDKETMVYSVTYSKGEDKKEGTMVKEDEVKVKDGMIFNATATDKS